MAGRFVVPAVFVTVAGLLAVPATQAAAEASAGPSGSDASCPAASPGAASSPTVTAPSQVHAIGGSRSATVVWCPPASGAGAVVRYTITSSAGQQVTARVPNDWAIVDGLTDGTGYTFTVTAVTKSGSTSPPATSNSVTPAPIPPPGHVLTGKPQTAGYDGYSMKIGGKRVFITAGEFDPFRTPSPSLWLDDLQKMKADGYNAVTVYFDWDYTSPSPGVYDFTGVRDMNTFLNLAQQAGLYVIARPGPYINAETDGGGIPAWLLTAPNGFRTAAQPYLSAALQWYSEIDAILAPHQVTRGGDVIAYQIENEYTGSSKADVQYMADLEHQARGDGIDVPLTFNQCCGSLTFTTGKAKVNISGTDNYPLGFDCANPASFGQPYGYPRYKGMPVYLPEFQGGSFDGWGGAGYSKCYQMTGADFENVFYKNNIAQGATMQSNYMGVGGTNWGWLPDPGVYTSYDYGAAIRETGEIGTPAGPDSIAGSKYGENKLINDFETTAAPLTQTTQVTPPKVTNPGVTTLRRANPADGTQFVYLRQADATSTTTVSTHIALHTGGPAGYYPKVPQQPGTAITLHGRDSRLLVANYSFTGQHLVYSTSELMTDASLGNRSVALLYDPAGTDGETVLSYASQPTVRVLSGTVSSTWDATRSTLRLDYVHHGLAEVQISGGGRPPLLLLLADTDTAEGFWPEQTAAGPVLVQGGYLVRTASTHGPVLALTGDGSASGPLTVWAPPGIHVVSWNGRLAAAHRGRDGALRGSIPGPRQVSLPVLSGWRFSYGTPDAQPGFDDSSWTLADHPVTTQRAGSTSPVLQASDYGYDHGFVWYRGHFTATGSETGVALKADGIGPTGAFSVWLNGAFLGSHTAAGPTTATFGFPAGAVRPGADNVIAVLVENTDRPEGPSAEPVGLLSAALKGSSAGLTWRMMGNQGGTTLQDPVRGPLNAAGLYGTNSGWDLPGYPDTGWQPVSLPDSWPARGVPPGIGWYRTSFSLHLPARSYVPLAVQIGGPGPGAGTADYRAFIFVNGWMIGRYVNNVGPQHQFYVPAGILNDHGPNTLAIAVWGLDETGGGLARVSLVAMGDQAGGVPVAQVPSPGYSAAVYGPPAPPQPTLAATPSTGLAEGTFRVQDTLRNPTRSPLTSASVSLGAPAGWTVSPPGPQPLGTIAPGASGVATFRVTPPSSGLASGTVSLLASASFTTRSGGSQSLINAADVGVPAPSLAATFNNTGITDNSNPDPSKHFTGFDGIGTSYSAQGLAADGLTPGGAVNAGGLTFSWPSAAPAKPDNTMAEGQAIAISGSGTSLGFLAAANNQAESGTGTIYYTDGSRQAFTLGVGNFWWPAGQDGNPANVQVAGVNYANYPTGSSGHEVYIFEQSVPLNPAKTVRAVVLPGLGSVSGYNPALHVFAMTIGSPSGG